MAGDMREEGLTMDADAPVFPNNHLAASSGGQMLRCCVLDMP